MKVLHIDEQRGWRGGEQQASWLLQGLAAKGHAVMIAARPGSAFLEDAHGGCEVRRFPVALRGEWDIFSALRIAGAVRQHGIDILHAHTSHAHAIACLARRIAGRGKTVVSRRVGFPPKSNPVNRWKYRLPDHIVCVSGRVGEVMRAYGIEEHRLSVVHSAVDPARLDVEPLSRAELGVPEGVPLLVSAGALVGHKDHDNLISALPQVLGVFPEARAVIAGEGELRSAIEAKIAALGVGEAVTLLGHRNDAPRLIRAGDCYVSSSSSEGLGTSILEALACKTPVVAAQAGGAAEMVLPGKTGHLIPIRDPGALAKAIIDSLANPEHARAMAEQGRALIEEKFIVPRMVEGNLRVYEKLLEK